MYKKITLKNGLRVLIVPQRGAKSVTVLTLVEAGSKHETKAQNGISHFLEHMMFKGTTKRPSSLAIATELDRVGGESNAFTSHEYTEYYAKVDATHLDLVLDVISDIFQNSLYDAGEIEKEKGVVIEEINMYYDIPMRHIGELWMELLYGDQPAGRPLAGTKETVQALAREDIMRYVRDHYVASKTVVVISGDVDENVVSKIEQYFWSVRAGEGKRKEPVKELQARPGLLLHQKKTDQSHLLMGFRAFSLFDPRRYAASVLGTILVGGMSSRLFQRLRDEMGVAYYVRGGADLFTDHGFLGVSCGVDAQHVLDAVSAILEECKKAKRESVPEDELKKAKDHISGSLVLTTETTDELAMFYGPQEILGQEVLTVDGLIAKIQAVSGDEVQQLANDIFKEEWLNLALIGPFEDKSKFEALLTLT